MATTTFLHLVDLSQPVEPQGHAMACPYRMCGGAAEHRKRALAAPALPLYAQTSAPAAQAAAQEKAARLALITEPLSWDLPVPQQRHFSSAHHLPGELPHVPPGTRSAPSTIYDIPPAKLTTCFFNGIRAFNAWSPVFSTIYPLPCELPKADRLFS